MELTAMRRGEVRLVALDPAAGKEAKKRRPAVIVSNDQAVRQVALLNRGVVTVVPLTSNTEKVYLFQAYLPKDRTGLNMDSKAQAEQVRALDVSRFGPVLGFVPPDLMKEIDDALRIHLGLE